jgi:hypothetical protein
MDTMPRNEGNLVSHGIERTMVSINYQHGFRTMMLIMDILQLSGDRNGLKRALLLAVLQRNVYRSENLDANFQEICDDLSAEGSLFAPYGGITKDAAQRKLLSILQDVQDNFHLDENSNLYTIPAASDKEDSLMELGLEVLRHKRGLQKSRGRSEGGSPPHRLLQVEDERDPDTDDEHHFHTNIRIPPRRTFVAEELGKLNIKTIGDLFNIISLSDEAKDRFVHRTGFQLTRPIHTFLGFFEEVMNSKNCNRAMERDSGLTFAEGSDLIEYLRAFYISYEEKQA